MMTIIYAVLATAFLLSLLVLFRRTRAPESDDYLLDKRSAPQLSDGRWLDLSERIFDPSDARWLAEEMAFPKLAKALTLRRKRLAIYWLETLQASFDEVVRTPDLTPSEIAEESAAGNWQMLWLAVRFKLLVSYALLVVRLFGPYHRLMPTLSWVPFPRETEPHFRRAALAHNRSSH
jgi:hypothetical protein